jgi:arylsulfatase A-like enzyme
LDPEELGGGDDRGDSMRAGAEWLGAERSMCGAERGALYDGVLRVPSMLRPPLR